MKENFIGFHVSNLEYQILMEKAKKSGFVFKRSGRINLSAYIRNLVVNGSMEEHKLQGYKEFCESIEQFRRVGINLNQVLKLVYERQFYEYDTNETCTPIFEQELKNMEKVVSELEDMRTQLINEILEIKNSVNKLEVELGLLT